jgi:two-component system NtrC family sensor kinase
MSSLEAASPLVAEFQLPGISDSRAHAVARICALIAAALAIIALLGWVIDVETFRSMVRGRVSMNPLSAIAFHLCALSLWLVISTPAGKGWRIRPVAQALGLLVILIGAQRELGYFLKWERGIDQLLFARKLGVNRIAPNTAINYIFVGLALVSVDMRSRAGRRAAVWLTITAAFISMLGISGYIYRVITLSGVGQYIPMALPTAICFLAICTGILFARPQYEPMATFLSATLGGRTARRLLPAAVIVPLILGYLRLKGEQLEIYHTEFGVSLMAMSTMVVFIVLIWLSVRSVHKAEQHRMAAEEALKHSQAFYHSLVENLPQNIFRKDMEGRFTFGNKRFCTELGLPLEKLRGKSDFDFFPADLAERYRADDAAVIAAGKLFETIEEHVTPDGKKLYVQVMKVPIYDADGKAIGIQGIFWDVTDKKHSEAILQQTNRLLTESVNSERQAMEQLKMAQSALVQTEKLAGLGQMVAGVAHEINNPLSFVNNNVAVLQRDFRGLKDLLLLYRQAEDLIAAGNPELAEWIREMEEQIDLPYTLSNLDELLTRSRDGLRRIQQIVRDLRDFARLDESDLLEIDLNEGIESTVNIIRGRAKKKQIDLEMDLRPLPKVMCFPAKINQVVMNLLANAIDACNDHGRVRVHTEPFDGKVLIEVADNGSGIEPAIRDRIFDPFFTTKPPGEGTGLGLSISYGIIQDHGGNIDLESTPGKGTCFKIQLPLCPPPKSEADKVDDDVS